MECFGSARWRRCICEIAVARGLDFPPPTPELEFVPLPPFRPTLCCHDDLWSLQLQNESKKTVKSPCEHLVRWAVAGTGPRGDGENVAQMALTALDHFDEEEFGIRWTGEWLKWSISGGAAWLRSNENGLFLFAGNGQMNYRRKIRARDDCNRIKRRALYSLVRLTLFCGSPVHCSRVLFLPQRFPSEMFDVSFNPLSFSGCWL